MVGIFADELGVWLSAMMNVEFLILSWNRKIPRSGFVIVAVQTRSPEEILPRSGYGIVAMGYQF